MNSFGSLKSILLFEMNFYHQRLGDHEILLDHQTQYIHFKILLDQIKKEENTKN